METTLTKKEFITRRTCNTCEWYTDTNVCVNSDSPLCADFVRSTYGCNLWEEIR